MDFPGQTREVDAAHNESASAASKDGPHPHLPFTFFDPASMHELERTMTARSTRSHIRPLDNLPPPPLPKSKKINNRKSTISIAMESGSGDDGFDFELTLKDLVRRYVIRYHLTTGCNVSQTG
jgi:ATP-binding cassette subfamily G (WHITE) protein 2 (SNQ2)